MRKRNREKTSQTDMNSQTDKALVIRERRKERENKKKTQMERKGERRGKTKDVCNLVGRAGRTGKKEKV